MSNNMGYTATKELLLSAPVPAQTNTYKPISHGQLIDLTLNGIEKAGFKLNTELYTATTNADVAMGRFSVSNVADSEMCLEIVWQNSYNRKVSLKFAIGAHVFVCSNGCVSGDMGAFKKKHKGTIQEFTPTAINDYISRAGDHFTMMQRDREAMKQVELSDRVKAELIGRMVIEEEILTSTQMHVIMKEMKTPSHNYNAPSSMWELYNFVTYSLKNSHPTNSLQNHIDAHNFFVNKSGLLVMPNQLPPVGGTDTATVEIEKFTQLAFDL